MIVVKSQQKLDPKGIQGNQNSTYKSVDVIQKKRLSSLRAQHTKLMLLELAASVDSVLAGCRIMSCCFIIDAAEQRGIAAALAHELRTRRDREHRHNASEQQQRALQQRRVRAGQAAVFESLRDLRRADGQHQLHANQRTFNLRGFYELRNQSTNE